jgi:hypothetical protein
VARPLPSGFQGLGSITLKRVVFELLKLLFFSSIFMIHIYIFSQFYVIFFKPSKRNVNFFFSLVFTILKTIQKHFKKKKIQENKKGLRGYHAGAVQGSKLVEIKIAHPNSSKSLSPTSLLFLFLFFKIPFLIYIFLFFRDFILFFVF